MTRGFALSPRNRPARPALLLTIGLFVAAGPALLALNALAATPQELDLDHNPAFEAARAASQLGGAPALAAKPALLMPHLLTMQAQGQPPAPAAGPPVEGQSGLLEPARILAVSPPSRTPVLALIDLNSQTVSAEELRAISRALHVEFSRLGRFVPCGPSAVHDRLASLGLLPYDPSRPPPTPAQLASALQADYLVMGALNRVGDLWALATEIYDARRNAIVRTNSRTAQGGMAELLTQIPAAVSALAEGLPEPLLAPSKSLDEVYGGLQALEPLATAPASAPSSAQTSQSSGAPADPLLAAQQEIAALSRRTKSLETDLEKQNALVKQYRAESDRLKRELKDAKERIAQPTPVPEETPQAADKAKAAELAAAAKQPGLAPEDKIAKLKEAVLLDPAAAERHLELAKAYYASQDYEAAERACNAGIAAHPADSSLRTVLGATFFAKGDYTRAEKAYREALSVKPSDPYAQYNLALTIPKTVQDGSRNAEALKEWERYLQLAGANPYPAYYVKQAKEEVNALRAGASPAAK